MGDGVDDPFTLEIIASSLSAAADEMFAVLRKTAMSPIIYEVLDVGTGITDAHGDLVSSGAGIPTFVGMLDKAVKAIIALTPADEIRPGDIFATNDPYFGGVTHLNDVVLAMPVFAEGRLIAWTANVGHWSDIGGAVPGSMWTEASDIFAEGLRLPAIKLFDAGEPVKPVLAILKVNSRLPDFLEGDLWASIASIRKGAERVERLVATYGAETVERAISALYDYAEARSRQGLALLPKGRLTVEEQLDDGTIWKAAIEITDDRFIVDLRDAPDQRARPTNLSRDGAVIGCQLVFKMVAAPDMVCNAGSFRPLEVLTRPGSVFDPLPPAPQGFYFETRVRLYDMLWRALAEASPERLPAGHFASICSIVIAGRHPITDRNFTLVEPQVGGWGASATRDGLNAQFSAGHGDTFNCPIEIAEARYGLDYQTLALNDEPGGAGLHHGGKGIVSEYAVRGRDTQLGAGFSRSVVPVWGLNGGEPGTTNRVELVRTDGSTERYAVVSALPVAPGEIIRITTAQGGGWGKAPE
ncbi:hydantoinase B/oxoprolinase family protein [Kaistia dalseonensis]|uniref:N-methylhydantoinase B n=1 Tax=Kaistia dalseonensis TaxID=410840 RepID=A0ABU0H343_9HYPH|nr:hydantoinase B/oxoprolinase family protein [Kaistia dalseonensis]MCX5493648.1 hydantoinase B/oxoprolinase family protein [Kaistia dalseonensis]MDQ0436210.1 N-methylhydantoinase B [Kaistia dalseonensis]